MARKKMFPDTEKKEIINYYLSGKSTTETGERFGITGSAVYYILKKHNISRRDFRVGNYLKWEDKEFRENQIEKRKGKPSGALGKTWKLNHIKKYPNRRCENNHFWKGGKTKLSAQIRNSVEYSFWRKKVFERDNYSCVKCGRKRKKGDRVIIEADHIYPFYKIIDDFNITSIEEAISCKEFWDVDNGRTLCRECHKKTDSYGSNQYTK